jgi:type II secretory pathway component PulF
VQRKISLNQQILCWQTLAQLTQSSIPLYQALEITKGVVDSQRLKGILTHLQTELRAGQTLSQSLGQYEELGARFNAQMLKLGETTGTYARSFTLMAQQLHWQRSWRQLIQQSLRYPLILMVLLGILFSIIVVLVLPGLVDQLTLLGVKEIPLATKILIAIGQSPLKFLLIIGILILAILGSRTLWHWQGRRPWRYAIPRLGNVLYRLQLIHFFHALGIMLTAKIDGLASLYHASQTPTCPWIRSLLQEKERCLIAGEPLSLALQDVLPPQSPTASLIVVGEKTGTLGELLLTSCDAEQTQLQLTLKTGLDLIQPSLVMVMGLLMVWVVLAVLLPLYESIGQIHG